jgi:hypothetical protein
MYSFLNELSLGGGYALTIKNLIKPLRRITSLTGIPGITKSQSTSMIKVRPLSLDRMELMHTNKCRLDYVMLHHLSNDA